MNVSIQEFECTEALKPFVQTYWLGKFNINRSKLFTQRVIPNGYVELVLHLTPRHCLLQQDAQQWSPSPDYTLIGLFTQPYDVHFNDYVTTFGIRFKPEGIYNLFKIPASEFSENYLDMTDVIGKSFHYFSEQLRDLQDPDAMFRLADDYLLGKLLHTNMSPYYLNRAAEYIRESDGLVGLNDLARKVFISERQLEREFMDKLGITPKHYMRIMRLNALNRMLLNVPGVNLTSLSYDVGFADQAHLIREFKRFAGLTPGRFLQLSDAFLVNV